MSSLLSKSAHGFKWTTLATATNVLSQIVIMAVMARLLRPSEFGLMSMANVGIRFLSYFAHMGVGPALVQKPELDSDDIKAAVSLSFLTGSLFFLVSFFGAPLAGAFFNKEELIPIVRVLGLSFLLVSMSNISVYLLRRTFRFKQLAVVEICSYLVGYGAIGIPMAHAGAGAWSLVGATLSQNFLSFVIAYAFARHPMNPCGEVKKFRHLLSFGSKYSVISFMEFIGSNLDGIMIGRLLGDVALGFYNRAFLLTNLPIEHSVNSATKVLFPALSELQKDRDKVSSVYTAMLAVVSVLTGAICMGMIPAAEDLVRALLGPQWMEAVPVVRVLCLSVPCLFLSHVSGVLMDSLGTLEVKLRLQGSMLVLLAVSMYFLSALGLIGFALAVTLTEAVKLALYLYCIHRMIRFPGSSVLRVFAHSAVISFFTAGLIWLTVIGASRLGIPTVPRLLLEILAGFLALVFCLRWFRKIYVEAIPIKQVRDFFLFRNAPLFFGARS